VVRAQVVGLAQAADALVREPRIAGRVGACVVHKHMDRATLCREFLGKLPDGTLRAEVKCWADDERSARVAGGDVSGDALGQGKVTTCHYHGGAHGGEGLRGLSARSAMQERGGVRVKRRGYSGWQGGARAEVWASVQ
jgi:hypothetical protein